MNDSFKNTFSIKNFRSYGENGAHFVMAPITILTGCNSSGKSSLVKAQLLLGEVLRQIHQHNSLHGVDFTVSDKELKLGRFDKVVHKQSNLGVIELAYTVFSHRLGEAVEVTFGFKAKPNDLINDGYLHSIRVAKCDGTVLFDKEGLSPIRRDDDIEGLSHQWEDVVKEALNPSFLQQMKYVDSASMSVCRLYTADDGDDLGHILRSFLEGNRQHLTGVAVDEAERLLQQEPYQPGTFLDSWIRRFGVGDAIQIKGTEEGLGIMVFLDKEGEQRLLADEGYGITQLFSLLLQIEVSILGAARRASLDEKGNVQLMYDPSYIYVEEPENHLHPKFQSLLANLFAEAYANYNIHFVVETHSEYMIRKLQVLVADKGIPLQPDDVSVNYIENDADGVAFNRRIEISGEGRLTTPFGSGFFDEADGLSMDLLRIMAGK